MINLLPPLEKQKLFLEKKKRMVIILWILVLFFLICLVLILLSVRSYLKTQVDSQKALLEEAETEFNQSEIQFLQEKINVLNLSLTELSSFYQKKIYFSEIIEKISQTLPSKTYLTNLAIIFSPAELPSGKVSEGKLEKVNISLSGFAPTRESLLNFKKNLDQESDFQEVYFPAANWVKSTDIDFYVTLQLK